MLVTSVPLPRATLSFGGCPLREIYPMAPLARGQSLAVGLTTYGGQVHVGLVADGKALPDLDGLAKNMTAELHALLRTTPGEPATGVEGAPAVEPVASAGAPAEPALPSGGAGSAAPAARVERPAAGVLASDEVTPAESASAAAPVASAAPTARAGRPAGRPARHSAGIATPAAPAEAAPPAEPPVPVQLALIAEPAEPVDLAR